MRIIINGEQCEVEADLLDQILVERGFTNPHSATAVNSTFVHKQNRPVTRLKEGDRVEIVAPIEGG